MISRTLGALQTRYDQWREALSRQEREKIMKTGLWVLTPVVFVLALWFELGPVFISSVTAHSQVPWVAPVSADTPAWFDGAKQQGFTTHGQYLAAQAIALSKSIYGTQNDEYYGDDPAMGSAIAYWKSVCQSADGTVCSDAQSGNLQCVEFVAAVFATMDDELPAIGDANRLWSLYRDKPGWQEIPASAVQKQIPALGDMVTWSGGDSGHLAMVVDVDPPKQGHDGSITVVQTEATDLFDTLTWHTNGQIDSMHGYTLQGFIRQQELAPCLQQQSTPQQQQWEVLAEQAAVHYGTPSKYLLRQICQSGFQATGSAGQTAASAGGGVGIAQMSPQIAAEVPRCVIDILHNSPNCAQMPGSLPAGNGIDPNKPQEALPAAAYEMSTLYAHYQQNKAAQGPQDALQAYSMALAAYHDGSAPVDSAVSSCQQEWLSCLEEKQPSYHTQEYINTVLGTEASGAPVGRNP